MHHRLSRDDFDDICRQPAKFLMYSAVRRALRQTEQFRGNARGLMVLVVDKQWIWHAKAAARLLLKDPSNPYVRDDIRSVVAIYDDTSKRRSEVSVVRPEHQSFLLSTSREALPVSIQLAADAIVDIPGPTARHVQAARRLAGVDDVDVQTAAWIARQRAEVVIGLSARNSLKYFDASLLGRPPDEPERGPKLSDLPGYRPTRRWVADLKGDVADWRQGRLQWSELSKGILLTGPPGTGKTLFATGLANELGFDLVSTSVAEWQGSKQGYLGDTLSAMSKSFADAASRRGAVLFIDELDAIGDRARMRSDHVYYEGNVIARFLELVTRINEQPGTVVVAATNYEHLIDPAILRSGRLEEHIVLELPDEEERAEMFSYHLGHGISSQQLRPLTDQLRLATPADIDKYAREAKRHARQRKAMVDLGDVAAALPAKAPLPEDVLHRIAVHESGHAIMALASGQVEAVHIRLETHMVEGVTVQDGGRVQYEMKDMALPTERQLLARVRTMLAGMAAEEVVFGTRSIGSGGVQGSDLDQATRLAYRLAGSYGLGKWLRFQVDAQWVDHSFQPMPELRVEVDGILGREYRATKELLSKEKAALMRMAAELAVDREIRLGRQS
ncbi:AAA family ATPase [Rhizobium deserti]|uniref:AAA family ATPase n=1 Tax=Rhizobium deserti TaxID=2547961 RepID=A0A4R5UMX7_9HYPH|nr:AAA family ATPase [Rhizobium deserti]TDK39257.1 AAA family ATPase [Rhizobium deserti]